MGSVVAKLDDFLGNNTVRNGFFILASSTVAPIAFKALGLVLGTGYGLAIAGGFVVTSTASTALYCYKYDISFEELKEFLKDYFTKLIYAFIAAAVIKKIDQATQIVSKVMDIANALPTTTSAVVGSLSGSVASDMAGKAGVNSANSATIGDGTAKIFSSLTANYLGGSVPLAVVNTELSRAIVPVVAPLIGKNNAEAVGALLPVVTTTAVSKVANKFPFPDVSNYNTAVFVGTGTGKIAEGVLKHLGIDNCGQISRGFSIMMTSATASGLGANPYGAVFGLTLSEATNKGVQKLSIFTNFSVETRGRIGEVAGTLATPVLSMAAKTMMSLLQLNASGSLETITYGVGVASEGFFKESRFKDNAGELGLGVAALTSYGGALISGANPLALVVATLFSNLLRTGVKKMAVKARCEERTAEQIGTVVGAVALPVVSMVSTKAATEYPEAALATVAAGVLFVAYQCNVHGYVAEQAWKAASHIGTAIGEHMERQRELDIEMFGSLEKAFVVRQRMNSDIRRSFEQTQHQVEVGYKLYQHKAQQPNICQSFDVFGITARFVSLKPAFTQKYTPREMSQLPICSGKGFSLGNFLR